MEKLLIEGGGGGGGKETHKFKVRKGQKYITNGTSCRNIIDTARIKLLKSLYELDRKYK